jgi:outer membrane receptor protein involved in Fe transport
VFGDLTYHITDRFDVQIGGRESWLKNSVDPATANGLLATVIYGAPTSPYIFPATTLRENNFTYLLTPSFKISPDFMIYARLASGYRPGGVNIGILNVPQEYNADKSKDYEIGAKAEFFDHTLTVDGSVYYIDWTNIQLPLIYPTNGSTYVGNAGGAKSEGVELSIQSRPVSDLTIAAWVTYIDAALTQTVPGAGMAGEIYGFDGARLPNTPRWSGNLSLDYKFPLGSDLKGFVGGALSYVGDRLDAFSSASPQRTNLPGYAKLDLRAGTTYNSWTANIYVNNVTDKYGLISGGIGNQLPYSFYYLQPRTIGLSVAKTF